MTDEEFALYLKQIKHVAENEFDYVQKEVEVTNRFPKKFFELAIDMIYIALPYH
ncbi:hypothetical protein S101258_00269 [Lactiplantibacillus plantarum subsp. plantarum]|uniref:Uncharacterized protein n=1 Tax=Lactiplantibacillus plantarum subsp. plantarum TaxID=337330 RepID=A0A2S3U9I1_LACPN|nr:hypothetical protein S101258_00269 [Lactiplantibacillus plantarum subsp. plantarum]